MQSEDDRIRTIAAKYVWWGPPGGGRHDRRRLVAQIMEIGTHEDAETLRACLGDEALKDVLRAAEPGWFSGRSWHYWHYALGLAACGEVPQLPQRRYT